MATMRHRWTRPLVLAVVALAVANLAVWSLVATARPAGPEELFSDRITCKFDLALAIEHANAAGLGQVDLPERCYRVVDDVMTIFAELRLSGVALESHTP